MQWKPNKIFRMAIHNWPFYEHCFDYFTQTRMEKHVFTHSFLQLKHSPMVNIISTCKKPSPYQKILNTHFRRNILVILSFQWDLLLLSSSFYVIILWRIEQNFEPYFPLKLPICVAYFSREECGTFKQFHRCYFGNSRHKRAALMHK